MRKQESSTRDAILRATGRVVAEEGVSGLTLDAVAREAGVSKGGLLYHFPSKDALIRGMIRRLIEGFTGVIEREEGGLVVVGGYARTPGRALSRTGNSWTSAPGCWLQSRTSRPCSVPCGIVTRAGSGRPSAMG